MTDSLDKQTDQLLSLIEGGSSDTIGDALASKAKLETSAVSVPTVTPTPAPVQQEPTQTAVQTKLKCFDYTVKRTGRRVMFYQVTEPDGSVWHRILVCVSNSSGGWGVIGRRNFKPEQAHMLATVLQKLVKTEE